jgi:cytochrome c oxidase subunit 2
MRRPSFRRRSRLLALAALLGTACAERAPQDVLEPAGPFARDADGLWDLVFYIAVAIFFLVEGLLLYALVKYRHRPGRKAAQFHGNRKLEVVLTAVPALILAGIAVPTARTIFDFASEPRGAMQIRVVAHQFWWDLFYEDQGFRTANELHIPTDQPVRLRLEGALADPVTGGPEVIHSFWVPRLQGTQDIVPGHVNFLLLQADEPGVYLGQCKEYCGLSHANMKLRVIAQEPAAFEAWAAEQSQEPSEPTGAAAAGAELFTNGAEGGGFPNGPACSGCHAVDPSVDAAPAIGPNLAHFASRSTFAGAMFDNDEQHLRAWLADPPGVKPGARMPDLGLTQEQIDALVAYLQSLE